MNVKLVYGFTVPKKIWDELDKDKDFSKNIIETIYKLQKDTPIEKYYFTINKIFADDNVLLGFEIQNLDTKPINRLEINEMNLFFNNNIKLLQEIFAEAFKPIITGWAEIIKKIADDFITKVDLNSKKIEIPQDVEIPQDLRVEWYVLNESIYKK